MKLTELKRFVRFVPRLSLNLFAAIVLGIVLTQGSTNMNVVDKFDPGLESAKWSVRFLLFCLTMSPLRTYFGWRRAITLRKSAGLWSLAFAIPHVYLYVRDSGYSWVRLDMPRFLFMGLAGFVILIALGMTSNRWAIRKLKKNWKRLHRLVYVAGAALVFHALLATSNSKKLFVQDPDAVQEIYVYIVLLSVLLLIRVPFVRNGLRRRAGQIRHKKVSVAVVSRKPMEAEPVWQNPPLREVILRTNGARTAVERITEAEVLGPDGRVEAAHNGSGDIHAVEMPTTRTARK